ncbi:hypothetical protein N7540_003516 [Penicillium herquei]|nr:hypothetical protein N7540_003516 [Penicillium herquei]
MRKLRAIRCRLYRTWIYSYRVRNRNRQLPAILYGHDEGSWFFVHLRCLSKDLSNAGAFFILRESRWRLNICVPDQPVFSKQPEDVRVIWGFALFPHCKGDCVHKSMLQCSGAEIMAELLYHLGLPNILIQHTITVPRVMPRMTSLLLAHSVHDRPLVSPLSTCRSTASF